MKLKAFRAFDKLGKFSKHDRGGLGELYSNPICPRKPNESDEEYKQRCASLMGPSVLMNIPSLGEQKEKFDRLKYYEQYFKNLSPSDFEIKIDESSIIIDLPVLEESKGRLRPADILRRKRAMAGKKAQIQRRKKRTMKRKKPLTKLKKIAYKMAYNQVYKEFMNDLFPGVRKSDLSIQQAKIVHKNVLRKKGRVIKRAKFKFLPMLRDKEAQKFKQK
jgi:hypothetical protein